MNKKEVISLIKSCANLARQKEDEAHARYQQAQDPAQRESALISTHANLAVRSTLQALLDVLTEDDNHNPEEEW